MLLATAVGLLLLTVDPLIIFAPLIPRDFAFYAHFVLGLPALFVGFFLLAPLVVWMVERTFGHLVAPVMRLDYSLLRQQMTGSLWRAAGTAAALMVGLAILVVMQVQGATLLSGWRLPNKFPDIFVVATVGLTPDQQKNVLETAPGIKPGEVLPIAVSSPQLGMQLFSIGSTNLLPDATMFFGIDPDRAAQMIEFEYYEGNAQEAMQKLKQGRHVIVTNEFKQLKGIKVGDKLPLKTPMSGTVDYTVAAVVWSPGLDVIVSAFDMGRQLEQRTVASVCGSLEDARRDFGVDRVNLFAVNLQSGVQKEDLAASLSDRADRAETPTTQSAAGGLLSRSLGVSQLRKVLGKYGFLVGDVRHIKYEMQQGFKRMLLLLSTVALAAIIVASLGVTNTIMASIRSRQWQFGILRSIGVTRGQLLRLILAEALLLGLAGCVLGLGAGFLLSVDANGVTRMVVGYGPAMVVPWGIIGAGVGIIIGVALFASIWPALSAVFQKPLDLLQWGRAAA
ncbi:MAG TPA: ABC transporter permease, partial [Tepidisphaeraceae bacterium]|nr:ABC transporter permease [Tepidisphaeraceae bacterium]